MPSGLDYTDGYTKGNSGKHDRPGCCSRRLAPKSKGSVRRVVAECHARGSRRPIEQSVAYEPDLCAYLLCGIRGRQEDILQVAPTGLLVSVVRATIINPFSAEHRQGSSYSPPRPC